MISDQTKITIIIPTRERADTLFHCLKTVVSQDYENFEIIVSDNHSQDNTAEVVKSFASPRIRYLNTGARLSMSHNWEFGLSHVRDGWVSILGDDDAMLPGGLARVDEVIRTTGCEAITSRWCQYFWPNSTVSENRLIIPITSGFEVRHSRDWLSRLMQGKVTYPELPWLYTGGFVDKRALDRARNAEGRFFCSMIPDVYSAIALASTIERYVAMKEPVSVAGVSSHSNGASSLGLGKLRAPAEKFFSENNIPFHATLGSAKVKSIPILVYESYLQTAALHRDFLAIDLVDQLALALAWAPTEQYEELRIYCTDVATRNGVSMNALDKRVRSLRRGARRRKIKGLLRSWLEMTVNASDFHVADVYGAALLSAHLYQYEHRYKNWRWRKVSRFIGSTFS